MNIVNMFSAVHTTAKQGRNIDYIVIHYSAGVTSKAGSAANIATYYCTTNTQVSSDFVIDDTTIVQYNRNIADSYTWHCGGSKYNTKGGAFYGKCTNANSIGIEICSTNDTGKMTNANDTHYSFTAAAVNNAVELVKKLMAEYDIPAERVIRHYDVNGKPCPGIVGWNADSGSDKEWFAFKARLNSSEKPNSSSVLYAVQVGAFSARSTAENYLKQVQKYFPKAIIKEVIKNG